ncbi:slightly ste11-like protein [Rhodotorula kratochvilovae]
MSYNDQYIMISAPPAFSLQPPPPVVPMSEAPYMAPSGSSASAIPIPISASSSRASSRAGTPSLSRSNSTRHHPYSASSSFSEQPLPLFRPRSATSASDRSEWDSEASAASYDLYGSSVDSFSVTPASSYDLPVPRPSTASPYVSDGNVKIGRNGKPTKSHSRKQAPGHIKRPPNAFILFRSHCCAPESVDPSLPEPPGTAHARYLASLEINNSQHISMIVSQVWNQLKPDEKAYWDEKARVAKEEHQRLHPEYRYRPQQRPKDTVRRRKKADRKERREERIACEEVAQQMVELASTKPEHEGDLDVYAAAGQGMPSGLPMPPQDALGVSLGEAGASWSGSPDEPKHAPEVSPKRKTRTRRAPAKPRGKAAKAAPAPPTASAPSPPHADKATSPESLFVLELQDEVAGATPTLQASSTFYRPHTAPAIDPALESQHMGDFSASSMQSTGPFGRRTSHTRTQSHTYGSPDGGQFNYMAQLDAHFGQMSAPPPSMPAFAIDPRLATATAPSSRPLTAIEQAPYHVSPFEAHYNVGLPAPPPHTAHPAGSFHDGSSSFPSRPATAHDDALARMQSYTLGGPAHPPATTSAPYDSPLGANRAGAHDPHAMLAERRAAPPPLPLDALEQRRGTIRASDMGAGARGDLMLISPMTTTFNGRRQSVGWKNGLRRVSLVGANSHLVRASEAMQPAQAPLGRRSSLATGVISANETFETFTFPQELLESLPAEDPAVSAEFFAQFTFGAPSAGPFGAQDGDEADRPSTAGSAWSENEVERLEGELPAGYLDRRRSTIVASKFASAFSSSAGSPPGHSNGGSQGYHVGSTDFFLPPGSALSTAATSAAMSPHATQAPHDLLAHQQMPTFGSPDFGGSFHPQQHYQQLTVDNLLAATSDKLYEYAPSPPAGAHGHAHAATSPQWLEPTHAGDLSATAMRGAALSVLHERRRQHDSTSPQIAQQAQFAFEAPLPTVEGDECTYVYLQMEQLANEGLMERINQQGYGIALAVEPTGSASPPLPSPYSVPGVGSLSLGGGGGSPVTAHSATF